MSVVTLGVLLQGLLGLLQFVGDALKIFMCKERGFFEMVEQALQSPSQRNFGVKYIASQTLMVETREYLIMSISKRSNHM